MNIALIDHPVSPDSPDGQIHKHTKFALLQQGRLIELVDCETNWVGSVYQGRVGKVSANFIFVDIGLELSGFLQNKAGMATLKQGDYVTVRVKRNPTVTVTEKKGPALVLLDASEQLPNQHIGPISRPQVIAFVKQLFDTPLNKIVTNNSALVDEMETHFVQCQIEVVQDPFTTYEIHQKLPTGSKVWLKSGGYLLIEKTTACTVIDINTGKHTHKKEDVTHQTNTEAIAEIAYQIRLRNISGMILIDLINNANESQNQQLIDQLKQLTTADRAQVNVMGITKLGLLELTRQKI